MHATVEKRELPQGRFMALHVARNKYLFTILDPFTRRPEAVPLPDIRTETVCNALLRAWVSRFGIPAEITADRGAQFTLATWRELHELLGIKQYNTTSYHQQAMV